MDDRLERTLGTDAGEDCCVDEVGSLVQRLVRTFQIFERDQIKVFGFTSSQCYSLLELLRTGGLAMSELSAKMNVDTTTMTRVIDNLVRDGLVVRQRDEGDRRYVVIALTDEGKEVAAKLESSIKDYYRAIIANLPAGEVDTVLNSVKLLLTAFEKANPNCC
ncbi:MAG: MarR family winged helix-turn-helix transcriptional regulator [Bacillota bacterium]